MDETPPTLLIIWHSRTGGSRALAEVAAAGGGDSARLAAADDVTPEMLLAAGAYLFVGPENLAALSGAMYAMRFRLDAVKGARMNPGRMQMDWMRY